MQQLNLPVQLRPEVNFANYVTGPNAEALAAVRTWAAGQGEGFLYLFGLQGCGKTHLLQAACHQAAQDQRPAIYVPLGHPELAPGVLDSLELRDLIALDDLQAVAEDSAWEHGLFHLFNRVREAGRYLLVSADAPLCDLPLELEDLRSRLGSGPGYQLLPLSEEDCELLLRESGQSRGLDLGAEAIRYIIRRSRREPSHLMDLIEKIDRESLRLQRQPSLWLVRRVLGENHRPES